MKEMENEGRSDFLKEEDYFMASAMLVRKRSRDPVTQVGACIVNGDRNIVGIGYNSFPEGCSDDVFPWGKGKDKELMNKKFYVCHAEVNAIVKNPTNFKNCTMYVTRFPCNECAKVIIQSGIKKLFYLERKHDEQSIASEAMFKQAEIEFELFPKSIDELIVLSSL